MNNEETGNFIFYALGNRLTASQKQDFGSNTHNSTKFEKQFCSSFGSAQILNTFILHPI